MSPRDLFGVAIRVVGVATLISGFGVLLIPLIGLLNLLVVGTLLLIASGPITNWFYPQTQPHE